MDERNHSSKRQIPEKKPSVERSSSFISHLGISRRPSLWIENANQYDFVQRDHKFSPYETLHLGVVQDVAFLLFGYIKGSVIFAIVFSIVVGTLDTASDFFILFHYLYSRTLGICKMFERFRKNH